MNVISNTDQTGLALSGGILSWYLGGMDGLICALIVFVATDYITWVMYAIVNREFSGEIGARGIFKKILIFAMVGIGHIIDSQIIGSGSIFRTAVIVFYLSNVGKSIVESAAVIGLPIPEKLKEVLTQLNSHAERYVKK